MSLLKAKAIAKMGLILFGRLSKGFPHGTTRLLHSWIFGDLGAEYGKPHPGWTDQAGGVLRDEGLFRLRM
jgi:hypothetical protein